VKLAIACAVVVAVLGTQASATDDRRPQPPVTTVAATTPPATPATATPATATPATLGEPALAPPIVNVLPAAPPVTNALPSPPSAIIKLKQPPQEHRFFDAKNTLGLTAIAVTLAADAISTQKGLSYPGFYEMNPLARPFVKTTAGTAVYNAGSLALLGSAMYVAHRTGHHKLERILPFAVSSWEGALAFRNFRVIGAHTK
jgi:hypothetical protein